VLGERLRAVRDVFRVLTESSYQVPKKWGLFLFLKSSQAVKIGLQRANCLSVSPVGARTNVVIGAVHLVPKGDEAPLLLLSEVGDVVQQVEDHSGVCRQGG
jgi:hypothetical protein